MTTAPALRSPIVGVSDSAWTAFVRALSTQSVGAISDSNGLGCFELMPRRLGDIGLMTGVHSVRNERGRQVWTGTFIAPLTIRSFLANVLAQYNALVESVRGYEVDVASGAVRVPDGVSRSGAFAILHRAGRGGLSGWENRKFPATVALFERAQGIF